MLAEAALALAIGISNSAVAQTPDPRLREVIYDPRAVVTVPVKRGIVTHILLDPDEVITDVASGIGSDCARPEAPWCVAAQAGGRSLFVKPRSTASAPNNLAVVTDRRTHSFTFVVVPDGDARAPTYRLIVTAPLARSVAAVRPVVDALPAVTPPWPEPRPAEILARRLRAGPEVVNSSYSIAEGKASDDIVPTLVFDDGRFTYFRFPGNRDVPAVFHVLGDGSETLVNSRMEDDLLVVDRVSRRLMLRSGSAVIDVWNDAFDLDGAPASGGATVPGIERVLKADANALGGSPARPGDRR
jgi:type IV secretion system protein VirB9